MGDIRERGVRATEEGKRKLQQAKGAKRNDNGKRWTYQSIADALVLSVRTVQRFFKGEESIDVENALNIFKALSIDASPGIDYEVSPTDNDKKGQLSSDSSQKVTEQSAPQEESSNETINIDELVRTARDNIRDYINERCSTMRVLGMAQPMGLNDIYTNVNILEKITKSKYSSIDELFQNANNENFDRISLGEVSSERVPGLSAVTKYSKLMILGKPGAGKTTFLKHIALQCINGNFDITRIPLFITLKDFAEADNQPLLLEYLTQLFDSELVNSLIIKQLIEHGRLIILFDGLDEVKETDYQRIKNKIKDFTIKYNKNQFIITCRIAAREEIFETFTDVEIADFDDKQIENFVSKWFTAKNDTSKTKKFIRELKRNEPIKELANIPILLTLLCLVFEQQGTFPQNEQVRSYINTDKLQTLLCWAQKETAGSVGDIKPYSKRAEAISIAISFAKINGITIVYDKANAIANASANAYGDSTDKFIEYIERLEKRKIFNNVDFTRLIDLVKIDKTQITDKKQQPVEVRESFVKQFIETLFHTFNLTPEMVNLSKKEIETLEKYPSVNRLIIKCKEAAVSVAPSTWQKIEDRMLRID
ncbi:hypothetical protein RIVM261_078710 [Rivularia sp. IAM M-261]|nr:hypothetical protein RIVM261_078710 [Rivularia sp. IAM M-261]